MPAPTETKSQQRQMTSWAPGNKAVHGSSHGKRDPITGMIEPIPERMWCNEEMWWHHRDSVTKMVTHVRRNENGEVALFRGDHRETDLEGRAVAWV